MEEKLPNSNPLARTISQELRRKIFAGELAPGERLPGERELAVRYHTNRNTLREAFRTLEQARLVTVRHGKGRDGCRLQAHGHDGAPPALLGKRAKILGRLRIS